MPPLSQTQCVVQTAAFATTHSPRYFHQPRAFHPERWLPASHPHHDPAFDVDVATAFKPFSMGPRGCVGQNMGYMQARILLAKMLWRFDWELVNAGEVDWERDLRLYAIWEKPPVVVRYIPVGPGQGGGGRRRRRRRRRSGGCRGGRRGRKRWRRLGFGVSG